MQLEPVAASSPSRTPSRWKWRAAILIVAAAACVVSCDALQRSLVYPARHHDRAVFAQRVQERFGAQAVVIAPFDAIVLEPGSPAVATAIWFHGNGNVNTDFARLVSVFGERGVRLVLAEYPGYGARAGVPSERVLVADARDLYAAVRARYGAQPVIVIGQSLGSGVAAQLVAGGSLTRPERLALITPFFDLPDAASHAFWHLPLRSLMNDRYDSGGALAHYEGPLVVVVAAEDRFVGAEGGRRLAHVDRPHGVTTLLELPGADHNSWLDAMTPTAWDAVLGVGAAVHR